MKLIKNQTLVACLLLLLTIVYSCKKEALVKDQLKNEVVPEKKNSLSSASGSPLTQSEIEQKMKRIISEELGIDEIEIQNGSLLVQDLGADELDMQKIRLAVNEEFDIQLDYGNVEALRTVAEWVSAVKKAFIKTFTSQHSETVTVPYYSTSPQIAITFSCKVERNQNTNEITKVTEFKGSATEVTNNIYDGNTTTLLKTVKTSYSFKSGSFWQSFSINGETQVTWIGEITVEVKANGVTTKYKTTLTHTAMVGEYSVNITNNDFTDLTEVNTPTNPGTPTPTLRERMERVIHERYDCNPALIVDSAILRNDLGGDELSFIELIMDIEREFHISISDNTAEGIITVADLYNYIYQNRF